MDLNRLQAHVDTRFDKLETKLDEYAIQTIRNTNDLAWISGSMRIVVPVIVSMVLGLIGYLLRARIGL